MATRSMPIVSWRAGLDRDLDLGADAVGRGDQDRVGKPAALRSNSPPKPPISASAPGRRGRAHQRLDQLHHAVAGIDVDAGLGIGEARCRHWADFPGPRRGGTLGVSYVEIARCAMAAGAAISGDRRRRAGGRRWEPGRSLSIPNLITLARIILVPVVVWAIISGEMQIAFAAVPGWPGSSDAVDGFLAKRFHMASELGAYLDPLADKAMIVSIYVALGIAGAIPRLAGHPGRFARYHDRRARFMLSWLIGKPMPVQAAGGLEAQHRGADLPRHVRPGRAGLPLQFERCCRRS